MKKSKTIVVTGLTMTGLILMSHQSYAGFTEQFNKYIGSEFSNASGFYIILAVIGVGILGKMYQHFFLREDEKPMTKVKISQHSHQRHHRPRPMIKKTS